MADPEERRARPRVRASLWPMGMVASAQRWLRGLVGFVLLPPALLVWSTGALVHALFGATPRQAHRYYLGFARTCLDGRRHHARGARARAPEARPGVRRGVEPREQLGPAGGHRGATRSGVALRAEDAAPQGSDLRAGAAPHREHRGRSPAERRGREAPASRHVRARPGRLDPLLRRGQPRARRLVPRLQDGRVRDRARREAADPADRRRGHLRDLAGRHVLAEPGAGGARDRRADPGRRLRGRRRPRAAARRDASHDRRAAQPGARSAAGPRCGSRAASTDCLGRIGRWNHLAAPPGDPGSVASRARVEP